MSRDKVYILIEEVITSDYNKYKDRIAKETQKYNSMWKKYNDKYFETLSLYLDVDWSNNVKYIV